MRTSLRTLVGVSAGLVLVGTVGSASADPAAGWTANVGTTVAGGVVTLDSTNGGTSYENPALAVEIDNNDTITFEWSSSDVNCAGGTPRVFVQGGRYNTFDADPAGLGACGTDSDGDGWNEVSGTIAGVAAGAAGHTGIVNDNPADPGTIKVRNLTINGVNVTGPSSADGCKNGGYEGWHKNQGACVSSFAKNK